MSFKKGEQKVPQEGLGELMSLKQGHTNASQKGLRKRPSKRES